MIILDLMFLCIACSVRYVPILPKLCMSTSSVITLVAMVDRSSRAEVWPEAKYAAMGAFIFLR